MTERFSCLGAPRHEFGDVWVVAITYLPIWEGWLHFEPVIDAQSRRMIDWVIDGRMRVDLVVLG